MKHKIIYSQFLLMALAAGVASCDKMDNGSGAEASDAVSLSLTLPGTLEASDEEMAASRLRCIVEIWSAGQSPSMQSRTETVSTADVTDGITVDLSLQPGEYSYRIWADYIGKDTASGQKTSASGLSYTHYDDRYYSTEDLSEITVADPVELIDNDMGCAYFASGSLVKEAAACDMQIALTSPFAKVSVSDNNVNAVDRVTSLTVSYNFPTSFNAASGEVLAAREEVTYINGSYQPDLEDGQFFQMFVLTGPDGGNLDSVTFSIDTSDGKSYDIDIPEDLARLERGRHIKISADFMDKLPEEDIDFEISYDIEVEDWTSESVGL